jgi:RecB family endonuclease NucS
MTTEIKTWQIVKGELVDVKSSLVDKGRTEALDLEEWIISNPGIIGHGLTIIGQQVQTRSGPLDILAIDRQGNLVIVELKRDMLPREALAQGIDYASDVATWGLDQ